MTWRLRFSSSGTGVDLLNSPLALTGNWTLECSFKLEELVAICNVFGFPTGLTTAEDCFFRFRTATQDFFLSIGGQTRTIVPSVAPAITTEYRVQLYVNNGPFALRLYDVTNANTAYNVSGTVSSPNATTREVRFGDRNAGVNSSNAFRGQIWDAKLYSGDGITGSGTLTSSWPIDDNTSTTVGAVILDHTDAQNAEIGKWGSGSQWVQVGVSLDIGGLAAAVSTATLASDVQTETIWELKFNSTYFQLPTPPLLEIQDAWTVSVEALIDATATGDLWLFANDTTLGGNRIGKSVLMSNKQISNYIGAYQYYDDVSKPGAGTFHTYGLEWTSTQFRSTYDATAAPYVGYAPPGRNGTAIRIGDRNTGGAPSPQSWLGIIRNVKVYSSTGVLVAHYPVNDNSNTLLDLIGGPSATLVIGNGSWQQVFTNTQNWAAISSSVSTAAAALRVVKYIKGTAAAQSACTARMGVLTAKALAAGVCSGSCGLIISTESLVYAAARSTPHATATVTFSLGGQTVTTAGLEASAGGNAVGQLQLVGHVDFTQPIYVTHIVSEDRVAEILGP